MTAAQIDRAVSRATGESVREIRRLGFGLADPADADMEPESDDRLPLMIDWDERDSIRLAHHA
jgi:hypothetical protein